MHAIEDAVALVHAGPHGEHVVLAHLGTNGGGKGLANRELVEEAANANGIGAHVLRFSCIFQSGGAVLSKHAVLEVVTAQGGA